VTSPPSSQFRNFNHHGWRSVSICVVVFETSINWSDLMQAERSERSKFTTQFSLTDTVMLISQTKLGGELLPERRFCVPVVSITTTLSQRTFYPHMPIGKVLMYRLLFAILFVCFFVCTVTYFSEVDKASGVKFCTVVHGRPGQGISYFGELCPPEAQKLTNRPATGKQIFYMGRHITNISLEMHRLWNMARRVDIGRHVSI